VRQPAFLVIVHPDRAAGAALAERLRSPGYTCRVAVDPSEVGTDRVDACLLDVPAGTPPAGLTALIGRWASVGGARLLVADAPLDRPPGVQQVLVKPPLLGPMVAAIETAREVAGPAPAPPAPRVPGSSAVDALESAWSRAAASLDDERAQQRFVQLCVAQGHLRFAIQRYRRLAENTGDPRARRQLEQVGLLLGASRPSPSWEERGMSPRLRATLIVFVAAAVIMALMAWWLG
jgi:hypothetical protein